MKLRGVVSFLLLFFCLPAMGQKHSSCKCAPNELSISGTPRKVFRFSNGHTIGLCGGTEIRDHQKVYSEFLLYECGKNESIAEWDAIQACSVQFKQDTLTVQAFSELANGQGQSLQFEPFYATQYYWQGNKLRNKSYYRKDLRKYSAHEISTVLAQAKASGAAPQTGNYDKLLLLAHRLFWAHVSGSKQAKQYLKQFEKQHGPFDGAIEEEFDDLMVTFEDYK